MKKPSPSSPESRNTNQSSQAQNTVTTLSLIQVLDTEIIGVSAPPHKSIMEIATINHAMQLHSQAIKTRKLEDRNSLIKFLNFSSPSHSGNPHHTNHLFDALPNPDSYIWNTIIRGYTKRKKSQEALDLFVLMQHNELAPNPDEYTYPSLLKACVELGRTDEGKQLHAFIYKAGLQSNIVIQNSLVHMYSSCRESYSGIRVFENMGEKNVISWTSMIDGYVDDNRLIEALQLFERMQRRGVEPNRATMLSVLNACGGLGRTDECKQLHALICKLGLQSNLFIHNSLIHVYSSCGELDSATWVFENMGNKSMVSWNSMICGYIDDNRLTEALALFERMWSEGIEPNGVTMVSVLKACVELGRTHAGKQLHALISKAGLQSNLFIQNSLIHMYCSCSELDSAIWMFENMDSKDVVSWNSIIGGYVDDNRLTEALQLFERMRSGGIEPDGAAMVSVLRACGGLGRTDECKQLHALIYNVGLQSNLFIQSSLIHMYSSCDELDSAIGVFENIDNKNVVSWTAMIDGYVYNNHSTKALKLFERMLSEGIEPNRATMLSVLKACRELGRTDEGKQLHALICKVGLQSNLFIQSSLIHMYSYCDELDSAIWVFENIDNKNVVSWTAMIDGYVDNNHSTEALKLFERMRSEGIEPNDATMVSVLKACRELGRSHQGKQLHALIYKAGLQSNPIVQISLIHMYSSLGEPVMGYGYLRTSAKKHVVS